MGKTLADSESGESSVPIHRIFTMSSQGRRSGKALMGLSYQGTNPIHEGLTLLS